MKLLCLVLLLSFSCFSQENELEKEKKLSRDYLQKMSMEEEAIVADRGVIIRPIYEAGKSPKTPSCLDDEVLTTYDLITRSQYYSERSLISDLLLKGRLGLFIDCWKIALQYMYVHDVYKISCPSDTAYGDYGYVDEHGNQVIKGGEALSFRVILHDVELGTKGLDSLSELSLGIPFNCN